MQSNSASLACSARAVSEPGGVYTMPLRPTSPWIRWVLRSLSAGAFCVAAYLAWKALSAGSVAGCGDEGTWDCGLVLDSRWSQWMKLPVSLAAASVYATMLVALGFVGPMASTRVRHAAWAIVTPLSVMAAGAAVWFTSLQWFVLGHMCIYCLAIHAGGILIAVIVFCHHPLTRGVMLGAVAAGLIGSGALIAGQVLVEPPPTYEVQEYAEAADVTEGLEDGAPQVIGSVEESPLLELPRAADITSPAEGDGALVSESEGPAGAEPADGRAIQDSPPQPPRTSAPPAPDRDLIVENHSASPEPTPAPTPSLPPDSSNANEPSPADDPSADTEPSPSKAERPQRPVALLGGKARLDIYGRPILGSPDASHVLVKLFDYTCPHCRRMHEHIRVAQQRYGDQLAVVVLPVPLNAVCNPAISRTAPIHRYACQISRYALAVWRRNPDAFAAYHDWLFEPVQARSASESRAKAAELIGDATLNAELASGVLDVYLKQHVGLYERAQRGQIPKLLSTKFTITGETNSAESLCRLLEERLEIKPADR